QPDWPGQDAQYTTDDGARRRPTPGGQVGGLRDVDLAIVGLPNHRRVDTLDPTVLDLGFYKSQGFVRGSGRVEHDRDHAPVPRLPIDRPVLATRGYARQALYLLAGHAQRQRITAALDCRDGQRDLSRRGHRAGAHDHVRDGRVLRTDDEGFNV